MRVVPVHLCCLLVCAGIFSIKTTAQTPRYTVTILGPVSSDRGEPFAINNSGQVTGYVNHPGINSNRAFVYANSVMNEFGFANGDSFGNNINALGDVTGSFAIAGSTHAYLYANAILTDLGTLGGSSSFGRAINDSKQVTGFSHLADTSEHAFLYSNGTMTDLGTLGGTTSYSCDINNLGEVVGYAKKADNKFYAFLYSGGQMTDLGDTLGNNSSIATGINDYGDVTGYFSLTTGGPLHAFVYSNQIMTDLGTFGNDLAVPYAINNSKQIVGAYHTPAGAEQEFLFSGGRMYDLEALIAGQGVVANIGFIPPFSRRINDRGQIVAHGLIPGVGIKAVLLTPKLHFTSISKSPVDGHIHLTGFGLTAQDYAVEAASTPTGPFVKIGMVRTSDDGTFEFEDSVNAGPRIYRVSHP